MYIVVNTSSANMHPVTCGFRKEPTNTTLATEAEAREFAEFCAKKWKDNPFHVMKLVGSVRSAEPPVVWKDVP